MTVLWSLEAAPVPLESQLDVDGYPGREPFWSVVSCELFEAMGEVRSWLSAAVGNINPEGWPIHLELLTCPENCAAGFASHKVLGELTVVPGEHVVDVGRLSSLRFGGKRRLRRFARFCREQLPARPSSSAWCYYVGVGRLHR